jgi:AraC-like DNA-binding protein
MRVEIHPPEHIRFTSDRLGFEGFRVVVVELPDEGEAGSGKRGHPRFWFACRPVREKSRTLLTFQESAESVLMSRISSIIPPNRAFRLSWRQAGGRVGTFEVHPRFLEKVLCQSEIAAANFFRVPHPRFAIDRRVDWLCQLLMQETEQGCPGGCSYFEGLASALLIAVASQIDPRLADAGHLDAQHRRIQEAVVFIEANFASNMSREEVARVAGLSPSHFSRLFHALVGLAPHQYLLRCRLRNAQELLSRSEERSIAETAAETGFADQAHFSRHFRSAFGKSPQEFRQAHKQTKLRAQTF